MSRPDHDPARRSLMIGSLAVAGTWLVGCAVPPSGRIGGPEDFGRNPSPAGGHAFNAWLRIDADGVVTVAVPRCEMGQGVTTALPMLVAETLDCDWGDLRYALVTPSPVHGNLAVLLDGLPVRPDDERMLARAMRWFTVQLAGHGVPVTGGSTATRDAWLPLQMAGAAARASLLQAASRRWGVPVGELGTERGRVLSPDGRRVGYGALAAEAATLAPPSQLQLDPAGPSRIIGQARPRLDAPAKVDGSARFGPDLRLPGQRYAAARLCPVAGGRVVSFDAARALAMPGVHRVVAVPSVFGATEAVVAVADTHWHASQALEAVDVEWDEGAHAAFDSTAFEARLRDALESGPITAWHATGDLEAESAQAARRVDAEYSVPALAHAAMEPACATARVVEGADGLTAELWLPTQVPDLSRRFAAEALGIEESAVRLEQTLAGGGFGGKGLPGPVAQVLAAARAMPGSPVQLLWSRENDIRHDLYRPPAVARLTAWLDERGRPRAWRHRSAGPSIMRALASRALPDWLARVIPDKTTIEGAFDKVYGFDAQQIEHVDVPTTLPIGFWRGVGHSQHAFFVESFIDEIALAAEADPLDLRIDLLRGYPRHRRVLQAAASAAGWRDGAGAGAAFGLALHESFGSVCAQVVQLSTDPTARLRIDRVVVAVDCGRALNPELVAQQMEGGVVYGLSAALYGGITVRAGRVEQSNYHDYPMLTAAATPVIETVIVPSDAAVGGIGEVATPPAAPALCNAIHRLVGMRVRDLPVGDRLPFVR